MSQGAEKSRLSEVGSNPAGPLKPLSHRCKTGYNIPSVNKFIQDPVRTMLLLRDIPVLIPEAQTADTEPPNVTECRKITRTQGEIETWTAGSQARHLHQSQLKQASHGRQEKYTIRTYSYCSDTKNLKRNDENHISRVLNSK